MKKFKRNGKRTTVTKTTYRESDGSCRTETKEFCEDDKKILEGRKNYLKKF